METTEDFSKNKININIIMSSHLTYSLVVLLFFKIWNLKIYYYNKYFKFYEI